VATPDRASHDAQTGSKVIRQDDLLARSGRSGRAQSFSAWAGEDAARSHFGDTYPRVSAVLIGRHNALRTVNVRKYRFDRTAPVADETCRLSTDFF
jgi:hypothetical protein